jgi:hypothetical protein
LFSLGNKGYWTGVPDDAHATPIRRELAELHKRIDKIVVSDKITRKELAPWDNTRIVKVADAPKEIAALKQQPGRDILILYSIPKAFGKWMGISAGASPTPPFPTLVGMLYQCAPTVTPVTIAYCRAPIDTL